jgi:thiol-disulfide isomerase/thioredoxin
MKVTRLASLLLLFSVATFAQSSPPTDLSLKDVQGRSFSLSDYKGKVVLVNFWATWCTPCRSEIPDLIALQKKYRNQGLQIIGITYPPEQLAEVRAFTRKLRMNYPVAVGSKATKTRFTSSETLPITVAMDREGIIRDVIEGIMYADEFQEKVAPLLKQGLPLLKSTSRKQPGPATQRVTIVVDGKGYRPSSVTLRRGLRAQLTFIRKTNRTCGTEIVVPAYGINQPLPLNTPVVITLTPKKSGRFKFTCGMDMYRGTLVVR